MHLNKTQVGNKQNKIMNNLKNIIAIALLAICSIASCNKSPIISGNGGFKVLEADRTSIVDLDYMNSTEEVISITTDATNWIAKSTAKWISLDKAHGPKGTTDLVLAIESNYKGENKTTQPRTGEVLISGGGMSLKITVSQLGYSAPVDPDASVGGIANAEELMAFAAAVNEGTDLSRWTDDNNEIKLLADIDLTGKTWIPIGNARIDRMGALMSEDVMPFTGIFNGAGFKIKGLSYTPDGSQLGDCSTFGLFGALSGATVKDLTVEVAKIYVECPALEFSLGGIAGAACNASTILNCTVTAADELSMIASKQTETGSSKRNSLGGIVGLVGASTVEACVNNCPVRVHNTFNTNNGGNSYQVGGIYGYSQGASFVKMCTNNAELGGKVGEDFWGDSPRMGGIIGTANSTVTIENCTNNGNVLCTMASTSDKSSRAAGIIAYVGAASSSLKGCVNNADVCFIREYANGTDYLGFVSGFVGQTSKAVTIENCENYGAILSDRWFYKAFTGASADTYPCMGVVIARPNKQASIVKNNKIGGKIGPYSAADKVVTLDGNNFAIYMLGHDSAARANVVTDGNIFATK